MELKQLQEIESEVKRFMKRVDACKQKIIKDGSMGGIGQCLENGAVKRAAIDLKNELSKLNK